MNYQKFTQKTGITYKEIEAACTTDTAPANATQLCDWLDEGDFDGTETAESLSAEWDGSGE